jgi:collagenase-like PrtC family protease
MAMTPNFRLTIGPVLYYWPRAALLHFYAEVAESAAHTVVLGEVVCSRRHETKLDDWLDIARDLAAAGKEVVLATQALIESESDLRTLRRLIEQDFLVEAGDASALNLLVEAGAPFVIGPHVNVYNRAALVEHAKLGAVRWVAPAELSLDAIGRVNPRDARVVQHDDPRRAIETEVFAYGRLPLAFSARCFTARHHRLSKDQCDFRCRDDADGLLLATTDGQPFLVLNGIQTQSAAQHCLIAEANALAAAGVARLRLSPHSHRFADVVAAFDSVMNGDGDGGASLETLEAIALPGGLADGFAHQRPGLEWSAR